MYQVIDVYWDNSLISRPFNVIQAFQYVLITNVQFDCYVHIGSSPGERYGEVLAGDVGEIRLPTMDADSIVLESVMRNPDPSSNGTYNGTYAQVYISDTPIRFNVVHKRPPIFSEQNKDSTDGSDVNKRPYIYIPDNAPVVVVASGLTSSNAGEVITDHETNRFISRWGSFGQTFIKDYNVGAVGLFGHAANGNVFPIPTDSVAGLSVNVTGLPAIAFSGTQPVNIQNTPTVNVPSIPAPTLRTKSYVAGFRNTGATADISTALAIGANNLASVTHDVTSTKQLKIQNIKIAVQNISGAATLTFELRKVNTIPTGGTNLTTQHTAINYSNPYTFDAESTAMLLPTGIAYANSVMGDFLEWTTGAIYSASGQVPFVDLYNISDGLGESPNIPAGNAGGWAIVCESSAAVTLKWQAIMRFTEE